MKKSSLWVLILCCAALTAEARPQYCSTVYKGLPLVAAEPMNGRPESQAFLKPFESSFKNGISTDRWVDLNGPSHEGKWMVCYYGPNKELTAAHRMSDSIAECVVISASKGRKQPQVDIRCN